MTKSFVHLHNHTDYSLLDGAAPTGKLMAAAAAQGMPAIAMTDHGNVHGAYDFYKTARAHGLNPIIGMEAYLSPGHQPRSIKAPVRFGPGGPEDVSGNGAYTHMTMWAQTTEGMHNLFRIASTASATGFYRKPRADRDLLAQHGRGLIATTGCPSGEVQTYLRLGMYPKAVQAAADFRDIFGAGNFYVELMDHGLSIESRVRDGLLRLARDLALPLVATNDLHYVERSDAAAHDAMLCINSGSHLHQADRFRFDSDLYYLRSADEMRLLFSNLPEACDNTLAIAEACHVEFPEGQNLMPRAFVPEGETEESWFVKQVWAGIEQRYPGDRLTDEVRARTQMELDVIATKGYCGYYLVVADFINWSKDNGIRVGPGRGSGAGSIAAYALRITDLCPIEHGLIFERFLNPERPSMPDFDIDFDERRRGEVIDYVTAKYGSDKVAQIVTIGRIKAKQAIKDSARIHDLPYSLGENASKAYPADIMGKSMPLAGISDPTHPRHGEGQDFRDYVAANADMPQVMATATSIEGMIRGTGVHAAGVIMSSEPLTDHIAVMTREADGAQITQFEYSWCEELGLVKMDFLGLANLTIVEDAIANIAANQGRHIDTDTLSLDDPSVYELLAAGNSIGVFQLESGGMRSLLRAVRPTSFKHLDATLALYRPGPMGANAHLDYANRKNGRAQVTPIHPELAEPLADILGDTYGLIVYQEQVMAIAQKLAGYSLGQADLLRRAMGKKKKAELDRQYATFRDGMITNGYSLDAVETLWAILLPFSDYAFNKAHTAAYGVVTYWTAWLKAHYPVEYMAALLTNAKDRSKAAVFLAEARRMGVQVAVPDVNDSQPTYTAVDQTVRVGFAALAGLSLDAGAAIVAERDARGPYMSFLDFIDRAPANVCTESIVSTLIKAGAFDSIEPALSRRALAAAAGDAIANAAGLKKARAVGQDDLFSALDQDPAAAGDTSVTIAPLPEWDRKVKLGHEREQIGLYISDHPLSSVAANLAHLGSTTIAALQASHETAHQVSIAGGIAAIQRKTTRKGDAYAVLTLEDLESSIDVLVWPRTYAVVAPLLQVDAVVVVTAKVDREEDGTAKLHADAVTVPDLDEHGAQPLYLLCAEKHVTRRSLAAVKALSDQDPSARPLRIVLQKDDGTSTVWSVPAVRLRLDGRTASELKALFGAGCLEQPTGRMPAAA